MDRRAFLKRLGALPLVRSLASFSFAPKASPTPLDRVRPTDPGWPAAAKWKKLERQVGGRMIPVPSPLVPCTSAPSSAACATRIEELASPYFIGEQPGGTQTSGWLDAWSSAPSAYAVKARTCADVAAAVRFARENNLRLVVKGGGHSYQGTSNAPDSLLVWTRDMHAVTLHDAFQATGCKDAPRKAVSIEAGARWLPTYNAVTTAAGRYVQGGGCCTVGVAGLIQSGGFGSFSKNYGTAASSLLEAEVVTADGKVVLANACTHPDLFWGLKGGGGGSLGVVTRVTLATHDLPEFFGAAQGVIRAKTDAAFRALIAAFVRFYEKALFNRHWGEQATLGIDNTLKLHMVSQGLTQAESDAAWQPFLAYLDANAKDLVVREPLKVSVMPARHYWDPAWRRHYAPDSIVTDTRPGASPEDVSWAGNQNEVNVFLYAFESVWLPASLLAAPDALAETLFDCTRLYEVGLHFNKGLAGAPAERVAAARDTAMNPAVLDAFALAIIAGGSPRTAPGMPGHEPNLAEGREHAVGVAAAANRLRAAVPAAGAYVSESNFFDKGWQTSYWGANYGRLSEVKRKYDPDGLFFVHNGVGSEAWSPDGFRRLPSR